MPLAIRFVELTMVVTIPVFTRTEAEAEALAQEVLGDKLGLMGDDPPEVTELRLVEQPRDFDGETVWGEAVPEDHMEVAQLQAYLAGQGH